MSEQGVEVFRLPDMVVVQVISLVPDGYWSMAAGRACSVALDADDMTIGRAVGDCLDSSGTLDYSPTREQSKQGASDLLRFAHATSWAPISRLPAVSVRRSGDKFSFIQDSEQTPLEPLSPEELGRRVADALGLR